MALLLARWYAGRPRAGDGFREASRDAARDAARDGRRDAARDAAREGSRDADRDASFDAFVDGGELPSGAEPPPPPLTGAPGRGRPFPFKDNFATPRRSFALLLRGASACLRPCRLLLLLLLFLP